MKVDYLDLGSKLILIYASLNIAFAIISPLIAHLLFPRSFVFTVEDEAFTGVQWSSILASSQRLGLWLVLQMDSAKGALLATGILTVAITLKGLGKSEPWAVRSILLSGIAAGAPFWAITWLYFQDGLYQGTSGLSLGIGFTILLYGPWGAGLILVAKGRRQNH